ncbi:MAG: O-antigen ligase family protein [bacterium]|nr:O-antigen ligase family protein [bacterium]
MVWAISLFTFALSWRRWIWCVYLFVFCIPLFNTLGSLLKLPYFSVNMSILGALTTSWLLHALWRRPISDRAPRIYLVRTPMDGPMLLLLAAIILWLPLGWLRFDNVFCPGFYRELPRLLARVPFFSLLDRGLAFTRAWLFLQMGLAYYLFCSSLRHREELRNVLWITVVSGAIVAIYGITQYRIGFGWVGINWYFQRINSTLNGPHAAGIYFATLVSICGVLCLATRSFLRRVLLFITLVLNFLGLWLTGTRSALFALLLVLGVLGAVFWTLGLIKSARVRVISAVVVVVLLLMGPGYSLMFPHRGLIAVITKSRQYQRFTDGFGRLKLDRTRINEWLAYRFHHYSAATRIIRSYAGFGAGLGSFDKLYRYYRNPDDTYKTAFAHAFYLDILAELGFPALLAVLLIYCIAIILSWRVYRSREIYWRWKAVALGLLIAFTSTYIANFVTSDFYYVPELQLWLALLLALVVRDYQLHFTPQAQSFTIHWRTQALSLFHTLRARPVLRWASLALALLLTAAWGTALARAAQHGRRLFYAAKPVTITDRILEYGIYHYERDQYKNQFARTAAHVYKPILVRDRYLRLFLRASHPDVEKLPVAASVYLDSTFLGSVILSNATWHLARFDLHEWLTQRPTNELLGVSTRATLHLHSHRTWNPYRSRRGTQDRNYGVDLGAIEWGYY